MSQTAVTDETFVPAVASSVLVPPAAKSSKIAATESLFDRIGWLYIFFREKVFRDDTARIIHSLWPGGKPAFGTRLIELGCGPGFYSCRLAKEFPELSVLGIDRALRQLAFAQQKAWNVRAAELSV